jgi:hypothetical protein
MILNLLFNSVNIGGALGHINHISMWHAPYIAQYQHTYVKISKTNSYHLIKPRFILVLDYTTELFDRQKKENKDTSQRHNFLKNRAQRNF